MSMKIPFVIATVALLAAGPLVAEDMKPMNHASMAKDASPSTKAFEKANADMHKKMMIDYSGNADVDFVRGMIPHHQGAMAMARVELDHGKDPKLRKLAEEIIKAQEAEIAEMQAWLKTNDK